MIQLSIVIPVTSMHGRLLMMKAAVTEAVNLGAQVIIVHDKRDHKTSIELKDFVNLVDNQNLNLIEGQYGNPGSARNAGKNLASRRYIAFWDSDDRPNVNLYNKFASEVSQGDFDIGIADYSIVGADGAIFDYHLPGDTLETCWKKIALQPGVWRMVFKSAPAQIVDFPALKMGEDQVFLARFLEITTSACISHTNVYSYFVGNESQLTNNLHAVADLAFSLAKLEESSFKHHNPLTKKLTELMCLKMLLSSRKIGMNKLVAYSLILLKNNPKHFFRVIMKFPTIIMSMSLR